MDLSLSRLSAAPAGVFSLLAGSAAPVAVTLEHAYESEPGAWSAKIPPGTYRCVRGKHRLHPGSPLFETFEITGVPGHQGILFHCGNHNEDSQGCVLLGERRQGDAILESKKAFARFMLLQAGVDEFQLQVT